MLKYLDMGDFFCNFAVSGLDCTAGNFPSNTHLGFPKLPRQRGIYSPRFLPFGLNRTTGDKSMDLYDLGNLNFLSDTLYKLISLLKLVKYYNTPGQIIPYCKNRK